ncbi:MAG: protein kinase domain-containing protein [Streptosporangiaceae bacterium]
MNEESPGHHADLPAGFAAGSRLGGYRLEEQIGAGGMAVVFRARDERLDRLVALKIMTPVLGSDDMFRQRFIRESRAAAAVDDPHIIPVYEAGEVGRVLFIAMRLVRGGDARSLLRREGPLPPERVASIISPVASALDAAHAAGLVHRDVKPANILLDRRPGRPDHVYLSDFGLSKSAEVSLGLTAAGQFLGTPDYTAPEQIEGLPVDGRTDQYALACAAFELLTGQAPFHRSESFASIWAHLNKPPPLLTERRPELPPAADLVIAKALAKAQVERYQSCWEFADALRDAVGLAPYDLGSVSDPGLSRAGSSAGQEADRGSPLSPAAAVSPSPDAGAGAGPGAGVGVPPPGEDTEASAIYAARLPAMNRDRGQLEQEHDASTADEQATDPGLRAIPPDPARAPENHPSTREDKPSTREDKPSAPPSPPDRLAREASAPALEPAGALVPELSAAPAAPELSSAPAAPELSSAPAAPELSSAPAAPELTGPPAQELSRAPAQEPGAAPGQPRVPPRRPASPGSWPSIPRSRPNRSRPATPRKQPGTPPKQPAAPAGPGRPAGQARRGRRPQRRRPAYLALTGAGVLLAAAAAVILIMVVTSKFVGTGGGHRVASPSAYSRLAFVPPPPGALSTVAFSPDGKTLSAGAEGGQTGPQANGITYLWDVKTGTQITTLSGGGAEAFSPDGTTLAAAGGPSNSRIYLWDVATRRKIATLTDNHNSSVESVAFSANGRMLAVNDASGTVYVWDVPPAHGGAASIPAVLALQGGVSSNAVAFSPRGTTLAMGGSDGQAYLWNAATGNISALSAPGNSGITSVAYSRDGQTLAAGETDGVTYVWDLAAQRSITLADPGSFAIESVAFSPDSKWLATGDASGKTYLWHLPATKPAETLTNPPGASAGSLTEDLRSAVFSVAFSPDGKTLATTDTNGHAYLWKMP